MPTDVFSWVLFCVETNKNHLVMNGFTFYWKKIQINFFRFIWSNDRVIKDLIVLFLLYKCFAISNVSLTANINNINNINNIKRLIQCCFFFYSTVFAWWEGNSTFNDLGTVSYMNVKWTFIVILTILCLRNRCYH